MMHGFDPTAVAMCEVLVHDPDSSYGQPLDTSWEERMLMSALLAGTFSNSNSNNSAPTRNSPVSVVALIPWLQNQGFTELASGLEITGYSAQTPTNTSKLTEPERRLKTLEALGGTARWLRHHGGTQKWRFTKIGDLTAQEAANNHPRSDEKTIRKDLKEAAEERYLARKSGGM